MMVTFVSQCEKNALKKTRRVLDAFANRIGDNTWQTVITEEALLTVKKMLRQTASKNTAVSCHWIRSRARSQLLWVVGKKDKFNAQGYVPVNSTHKTIEPYIDKHSWKTLNIIEVASSIAGLFHDFGKANKLFQEKIDPNIKTEAFEPYRHEWISLRLFQAFVGKRQDLDWLERLAEEEFTEIDPCFRDGIDNGIGDHPIESLPPFAKLIAWIIVSHHRLPLVPAWLEKVNTPSIDCVEKWLGNYFNAQWNSYRCNDKEQKPRVTENWQIGEQALPYNSAKWRSHASNIAAEAITKLASHDIANKDYINNQLFTSHLSRLAMMLADRYYSSQSEVTPKWRSRNYQIYANSYSKYDSNSGFKQKLDEHLIGVAYHSQKIVLALSKLNDSLTELDDNEMLSTSVKKNKDKYGWQDSARKLAKRLGRDTLTYGFFGINMASTGRGKTIANAKIMYALGEQTGRKRFSVAIGLRTLTLQTGREFQNLVGISDEQLAIAVGGSAVKQLFDSNCERHKENQEDKTGSESSEEELDKSMFIHLSADNLHSLSKWTRQDKNISKLLEAPALVCTIDHLISATEGVKGGRQTAAMLRLLTSDLILDEPDDFSLSDLPALCRLVHWAGLLGSKVLLSTATMPPAQAFALFDAYRAGWQQYAKANIAHWNGDICCAWFDEFNTSHYEKRFVSALKPDYQNNHQQFVDKRITELSKLAQAKDVKQLGEIIKLESGEELSAIGTLALTISHHIPRLHINHHVNRDGKQISVGLVRMANINPLVAVAKALLSMDAPSIESSQDTCIHYCIYHSGYPLAIRNYIENQLDSILNRKDEEKFWDVDNVIGKAINNCEQKHHIFVVLASPVAEVGRDHDYDWAIVEPSSMRSIIQLAGRVLRHRDKKIAEPNILLLDQNARALKGKQVCFTRPGFEMKNLLLSSKHLNKILKPEQYRIINSTPRINLPTASEYHANRCGKFINLNALEHKALAWQLFSGEKQAKVWWNNTLKNTPHWCGEVQRQQRFRDSQKDEAYYLWQDNEHQAPYWRWFNENVSPAKFGEISGITINSEEESILGNNCHFWFQQSPRFVYQQLAEQFTIPLSEVSWRFGELRIIDYNSGRDTDYFYHNNLGFYQEVK
ncbi:type I-F CRISPR-associated helicase Cas3f [Agarilytica rhodophyticola]|uniref:type I-F CRISPR-associated helicase Cas3f n=1 Tax=Agarilytica rhodophyticola TaxID=1737490 RepID=UPI000B345D5C|nr:type I-F CRISPR-associated helicase Cas3f [Agarilytica rhodophyticola]